MNTYVCKSPFVYDYRLGAKIFKTDNRILLGVAILCGLFGSLLCADWQGIGRDPCSSATLNDSSHDSCNTSYTDFNSTACDNVVFYNESIRLCEARSTSSDHCFWNLNSQITGEFCNTCLDSCLSKQKTINFYQFVVGVLLVSISISMGYVFIPTITSDITSTELQVCITIAHQRIHVYNSSDASADYI